MTSRIVDYYELLGISHEATGHDIRQAFRKLARQFHPDLAMDKSIAEERFKQINEAYEILSDPLRRQRYDRTTGRRHRSPGFQADGSNKNRQRTHARPRPDNFRPYTESQEFRSFYDHYFGRKQTNGCSGQNQNSTSRSKTHQPNRQPQPQPQRGKDISGELSIALTDVLRGSVHTVRVLRKNPMTLQPECRSLHVRIPVGVYHGQVLRLTGKGDYGLGGGDSGDLYLTIRITPNDRLRIMGHDVLCPLPLGFWEALFGVRKTIAGVDGNVSIKVPPGTRAGHRLRLRGRGLPKPDGTRGDLYAVVSIKGRIGRLRQTLLRTF